MIELAFTRGIALVASNEPFFATREDYEAHDALLCIAEGRLLADGERRQLTPEHRFKSRAEMAALFADLPEALAATVEIAERCAFRPRTLAPILPRFSTGPGQGEAAGARETKEAKKAHEAKEAEELRRAAFAGLERRLARYPLAPGHTAEDYRERLSFELGVIASMKYAGYFLIVADFIQWAKAQGIPVGPGRGSGAGSLVAYALTITDLDPIRFGLLFERFLNPERISMPDFDIDFCQERRDEVDPLRAGEVRPRPGRADHHLRHLAGARRAARRRPRAADAVRPGRPAVQAGAAKSDQPDYARSARSTDEPRLQAERDRDPVTRRAFDIAQKLEGPHPPRLHACGRHRHRRPAADRAGAALPRSEIA